MKFIWSFFFNVLYVGFKKKMVGKRTMQPRRKRMSDLVGIKGQQRRKTALTKSWDDLTVALEHCLHRVKSLNPLRCDVDGETLVLANMVRLGFEEVQQKAEEHATKRTKDYLDTDGWNTESEYEFDFDTTEDEAELEREARNGGQSLELDGSQSPTF